MSKIKLLYINIICLLILQGCKRGETDCGDLSDVITNYNISASNKAKIPYSGTDTLVFISDANDTATLIGQGKIINYEKIRSNISGGDCPRTGIRNYESVEINYIGDNDIKKVSYLVFKNDFDPKNLTGLKININNQINIIIGNTIGISYEYVSDYLPIQDSIYINNKYTNGGYIDTINKVLYNKYFGILKFKDSTNKVWFLNCKK